jgi:hypothetical protein
VTRAVTRLVIVALATTILASCADTVIEDPTDADTALDGSASPTTTAFEIDGTTAELLAELSVEMSQLSAQIADEGDEQAALERIDAIWVIARPDVEATRPELVNGIDTTVDMARTAVVRIRPADADKAFSLLTDLVDRYTGDG